MSRIPIEPGSLWHRIVDCSHDASRQQAIFPIPTTPAFLEQQGIRFLVRVVGNLERKDRARGSVLSASQDFNPFLPYDERMYVGDISDTHVCLLNKYNVVDHHALIVTRDYEPQSALLTPADFHALWSAMREFPSLGFYNAGADAGASQHHKHLQIVPVPLSDQIPNAVPLEPAMRSGVLPFVHRFIAFRPALDTSDRDAPGRLLQAYRACLDVLPSSQSPYNLLATNDWMLLVPRSREHVLGMSINALGFAGALLVRTNHELETAREHGPLSILRDAAIARSIE